MAKHRLYSNHIADNSVVRFMTVNGKLVRNDQIPGEIASVGRHIDVGACWRGNEDD